MKAVASIGYPRENCGGGRYKVFKKRTTLPGAAQGECGLQFLLSQDGNTYYQFKSLTNRFLSSVENELKKKIIKAIASFCAFLVSVSRFTKEVDRSYLSARGEKKVKQNCDVRPW